MASEEIVAAPPPVDLAIEKPNGDFVRAQIGAGRAGACHDLSDGGLAIALAEMAMSGGTGLTVTPPEDAKCPAHAWLFGEEPSLQIREDLQRFKQLIETGEIARSRR